MKKIGVFIAVGIVTIGHSQNDGMMFSVTDDNYIVTPHNTAIMVTNDFSIECWILPFNIVPGNMSLVQKGFCSNTSFGYGLSIRTDSTVMLACNSNGHCSYTDQYKTTTKIYPGECVQITATFSSSGPKIYFDGVLQPGYYEVGAYSGDVATNTEQLQIGIYTALSGLTGNFDGIIDELRIWSKVLTPSEIIQNMAGPLTGTEVGLELYYNFDSFIPGDGATIENIASTGAILDGTVNSLSSSTPSSSGGAACFASVPVISDASDLSVYPNPSSGAVVFDLGDFDVNVEEGTIIRIFNSLGELVYEESVMVFPVTVSLDGRAHGIYNYSVSGPSSNKVLTGKISLE